MFEKQITFDRFIKGIIAVAGLGLAYYFLNRLSSVLLPFFIAWLFAYMIYPVVVFFQHKLRLRNRILCIVISLILILAGITCFFCIVIPPVISEFMKFRPLISEFIRETGHSAIAQNIELFFQQNVDQNNILRMLQRNDIMGAVMLAIDQLWHLVSQTFNFIIALLGIFMMMLYLFFILMDYEKLSEGWIKLVPKRNRAFISGIAEDVKNGMNSYFRGQALVAFLVGILFSTGFVIIDFPMAIGLGMFIGFLNLVPYLQTIGIIPTILLALLKAYNTGENFWLILLAAAIVFVVVQIIQDGLLVPNIMGKLMGLNPAVILLSLSIWGSLLGLIGLIIALPLTTLLLSYYRRFIEQDEQKTEKRRVQRKNTSKPHVHSPHLPVKAEYVLSSSSIPEEKPQTTKRRRNSRKPKEQTE